jgi:hypothetical protein
MRQPRQGEQLVPLALDRVRGQATRGSSIEVAGNRKLVQVIEAGRPQEVAGQGAEQAIVEPRGVRALTAQAERAVHVQEKVLKKHG